MPRGVLPFSCRAAGDVPIERLFIVAGPSWPSPSSGRPAATALRTEGGLPSPHAKSSSAAGRYWISKVLCRDPMAARSGTGRSSYHHGNETAAYGRCFPTATWKSPLRSQDSRGGTPRRRTGTGRPSHKLSPNRSVGSVPAPAGPNRGRIYQLCHLTDARHALCCRLP